MKEQLDEIRAIFIELQVVSKELDDYFNTSTDPNSPDNARAKLNEQRYNLMGVWRKLKAEAK